MSEPETLPVTERGLLLAYLTSRYAGIADAHNRLADLDEGSRAGAWAAKQQCDRMSLRWSFHVGLEILDNHERYLAVLRYLVDNSSALSALTHVLITEENLSL